MFNQVKNRLFFVVLLCIGLFTQTQGMQYVRRTIGINPVLKTRLLQPALKRIGAHQSFNTARYQTPRQSWLKRLAKWGTGATLATTASSGAAAHYVHNLPDEKRYPTVSKFLDYNAVQNVLNWFPNFGRKLAAYWRADGVIKSFEQEIKKDLSDARPKEICINKWPEKCLENVRTQTEVHINMNKYHIKNLLKNIRTVPKSNIFHTVDLLLQEEREYQQQGYYSFYHGCKKEVYFAQLINTKLDELLTGKKTHFLILRQSIPKSLTPSDYPLIQNEINTPQNIRATLVAHGATFDGNDLQRQFLLSVNPTITGNSADAGECTFFYFAKSCSGWLSNLPKMDHRKREIWNQCHDLYQKDIEELDKLVADINGGICLHIGIKKELIDECTFLCEHPGRKISIQTKNKQFIKPSEILDTLRNNPSFLTPGQIDSLQFRLVLTQDLLLNPYDEKIAKNITIKAWSFEQDKLNELHHRVDELMEKIKHDTQLSNKQIGVMP